MKESAIDQVLKGHVPEHVAIIMDGNGRWAKARALPRIAGHKEGINSVREITRVCGEIGVKHLTLYTFSTENWKRPSSEVSALMHLLLKTIKEEIKELHRKDVRFTIIGDLDTIPIGLQIRLKPGWKTYWRSPGVSGLPPSADLSKSSNLSSSIFYWPLPYRFSYYDIDVVGYSNEVILFEETTELGSYEVFADDIFYTAFSTRLSNKESPKNRSSYGKINSVIGNNNLVWIEDEMEIQDTIESQRHGILLWRLFLIIAIILFLLESYLSKPNPNSLKS